MSYVYWSGTTATAAASAMTTNIYATQPFINNEGLQNAYAQWQLQTYQQIAPMPPVTPSPSPDEYAWLRKRIDEVSWKP